LVFVCCVTLFIIDESKGFGDIGGVNEREALGCLEQVWQIGAFVGESFYRLRRFGVFGSIGRIEGFGKLWRIGVGDGNWIDVRFGSGVKRGVRSGVG
jgi:hypothetical protein